MMRTSFFRTLCTSFLAATFLLGCTAQEPETKDSKPTATLVGEATEVQATAKPTTDKALAAATSSAKSCEGKDGCDEGCLYKDQHGKPIPVEKTVSGAEAACPHAQEAKGKGHLTGAPDHFGAAFTLNESLPLSKVLADASDRPGPVMQVTGTIDAVCQKKGCWMVIKDGAATARVLMKNHSFAIPIGAKGKEAIVEGALKVRTFSEAQVKHLEADRGGDPNKVSGTRREYVLTANGVRISS